MSSAAFSGDGKRLLVGKFDGTAELWELDALLKTAGGADKKVADQPPAATGEVPAAPSAAEKAPIEPATPKAPGLVLAVKHGEAVNDVAVSADGSTLMTSGNGDKMAQLWNAADGKRRGPPLMHPFTGVMFLRLSADGRYAVTGTGPGLPPPLMVNNQVFVGQNTSFPFMLWDRAK